MCYGSLLTPNGLGINFSGTADLRFCGWPGRIQPRMLIAGEGYRPIGLNGCSSIEVRVDVSRDERQGMYNRKYERGYLFMVSFEY